MHFYRAEERYSASGDPAAKTAMLQALHPQIVLHQPESLPYGGIWRGREGFERWLDAFTKTWTSITPTDPVFYTCDTDTIVSTVTMRASAPGSGTEIIMPMCQVIRFSDELPVEWRNFAWDTAKMMEALRTWPLELI
jgi:uncharacterized protein